MHEQPTFMHVVMSANKLRKCMLSLAGRAGRDSALNFSGRMPLLFSPAMCSMAYGTKVCVCMRNLNSHVRTQLHPMITDQCTWTLTPNKDTVHVLTHATSQSAK
jgi:hypothetical protein